MNRRICQKWSRFPVLAGVLLLASCDSAKRQALRELEQKGIEASGVALLGAAEDGDAETAKLLLRVGVFTGHRDSAGRTPLHRAIEGGHHDVAWALIEAGADVNATSASKVSPLSVAVESNEPAIANGLIERGASPDGLTSDGARLLPWAIRHGRSAFVRRMIDAGADPHQKDERGTPLLHVAMQAADPDLADQLIRLGADCGVLDADGESVLVLALKNGWTDRAKELVRRGADPNLEDREGLTPFERAVGEGDPELAAVLLASGTSPRAGGLDGELARAYLRHDRTSCETLLRLGADPSPDDGECLIRLAARDDDTAGLHLFLCYHPVPEGILTEFTKAGRRHIAGLLLAHGANPNPSRTPFLETPFGTAMLGGGDRLACRLLDHGASPEARTIGGQSPLAGAIVLRRMSTVRRLLENGANANAGIATPVPAAFREHVRGKTMRWLLRKDSRISVLMLAVDSGSLEVVDALLDHGASTNVWTRRHSIWPINIAAGHGDVKMMRLLLGKDPHVEERTVEIRLSEQRLRVYAASGEEVFSTKVSTGKAGYRTPTGEFAITNRNRTWTSTIYHSSMPYFQRLSCRDFGFHQGYVPNYPASHGCIRVPAGKASKLFALTELGDRVRILP